MTEPWITEPGRYELSEAEYHADPVVGGSLSSTGARTLATKSASRFAWDREHGRTDTDALLFGRAYHVVLLDTGADLTVVDAKTWRGAAAEKARDEALKNGSNPVLVDDLPRIRAMVAVMRADPDAGPLLARPGRAETSYFARDPDTGVMRRARVDFEPTDLCPGDRRVLVDAKTTSDAHPGEFASSMGKYGYHQQHPWYCDVVAAAEPDPTRPPSTFVLLCQEKTPPYDVLVASPDDDAVAVGRELNSAALRLYAACTAAGRWPSYDRGPTGVAQLALPGWRHAAAEAALDRIDHLIGALT